MALYSDQVTRVSFKQIRGRFWPRDLDARQEVELEHDGVKAIVRIVRVPANGAKGGYVRAFECPACSSIVRVVGVLAERGWGCRRCFVWRARTKRARVRDAPAVAMLTNRSFPMLEEELRRAQLFERCAHGYLIRNNLVDERDAYRVAQNARDRLGLTTTEASEQTRALLDEALHDCPDTDSGADGLCLGVDPLHEEE